MNSSKKALEWMKNQKGSNEFPILFRGQNQVYKEIKPTISRLEPNDIPIATVMCSRFSQLASGLTGFIIEDEIDRLAILQHYLEISPVIDLTGTPEIALYFALLNANPGTEAVVYSLDSKKACENNDIKIVDHSFLVSDLFNKDEFHRWWRQDGFGISLKNWRDQDSLKEFNLLSISGINEYRFKINSDDNKLFVSFKNLTSVKNDPLPIKIRGLINIIIKNFIGLKLGINLKAKIDEKLPDDPDTLLFSEMELCIKAAEEQNNFKVKEELIKLKSQFKKGYWDTSTICFFEKMKSDLLKK